MNAYCFVSESVNFKMDISKANDFRTSSSEGLRLSIQLDKRKENMNFFKDLLQLVDRVEKGSEEVQVSRCPVCIRLENKYKCCKARIADMEEKLEKVEAENEALKEKLNALELLSGKKHTKLVKLSKEVEIQKGARFEAETKLNKMLATIWNVHTAITGILTQLQSGDNQNLVIPQTRVEKEDIDPKVTKKVCEGETQNIFEELSVHVSKLLNKWEKMQMKTRLEVRTVFVTVKRMEERILQSEIMNVRGLPRVELIPPKKITVLKRLLFEKASVIKPLTMPSSLKQRSADKRLEISRIANHEKNTQDKHLHSKSLVGDELPLVKPTSSEEIFTRLEDIVPKICSKVPITKHAPMPSAPLQRSAERNLEISRNEIIEQHRQSKDPYPNKFVDETCQNIQPHIAYANRYRCDEETGGTCSTKINQQLAHLDLNQNDKPYDLIRIEIEGKKGEAEYHFTYGISGNINIEQQKHIEDQYPKKSVNGDECSRQKCSSIDGTCSKQSYKQVEVLQRKRVETMSPKEVAILQKIFQTETFEARVTNPLPTPILIQRSKDGKRKKSRNKNEEQNTQDKNLYTVQCVEKPDIFDKPPNVDENGSTSHDNTVYNTDATISNEVQQQITLSDSSQDNQLKDLTTVKKTHYQIQAEGDMGRKKFHCKCGKSYLVKSVLDNHIMKRNEVFQCNICNKKISSKQNLDFHIKRMHQENRLSFPCKFCNKSLSSRYTLHDHLKIHMGQRNHKCYICSKSYVSKSILTSHRKTHSNEKKHKCSSCDRKFFQINKLKAHMKIHMDEKKYRCSICDRKFFQKCHLDVHMRTHTQEKPYKCNSCGKCFKTSWSLKSHQVTHSGEKPHKCPLCSASFALKTYLKIHQRRHTNLKK